MSVNNGGELPELEIFEEHNSKPPKKLNPEEIIDKNKVPLAGILIGAVLIGAGAFLYKDGYFVSPSKIEVLDTATESVEPQNNIVVEVSGAVQKPGVYKFGFGSRVEDLLIAAGGISADADRIWAEKYINRAAKLSDGQKLFIMPKGNFGVAKDYQSTTAGANNYVGIKPYQDVLGVTGEGLININTATLETLDMLPGIGQVYGKSIIEHRPYSSIEELQSSGALKKSVYDKVKDLVTTY